MKNNTKECRKCNIEKPISDFYYRKDNKRYRTLCKECWYTQSRAYILQHPDKQTEYNNSYNKSDKNKANQRRYYENNHEHSLWSGARQRAKTTGIPFNLDVSDIIIPDYCPILGIALAPNRGKVKDNSATVDRIVPELGYTKGNIQVLSHKANAMKYNATPEELLKFARWVNETYQ